MAHIQVYYRDLLKDEVELQTEVTTIGRSANNDVKIDNAGVSAHHAKIIRVGDDFVIEDAGSRNGTFVNGKRVSRQPLSSGDEVIISKHILKLATSGAPILQHEPVIEDEQQLVQSATVEVDVSNLGDLINQRQSRFSAYLLLTGATQRRAKYPLTKLNFKIGKATDADLYTPGWFAPRVAARIACKSDGFYVIPASRGKVRVNDMPIHGPVKLEDGDRLSVRGLSLMFYNQPEAQK